LNKEQAMNDLGQDEGGEPLTAEEVAELLYRQVASHDAFDAIEGATRRTPTEFMVHPFDGPALLATVAPVPD
jgi:hypothetical protein